MSNCRLVIERDGMIFCHGGWEDPRYGLLWAVPAQLSADLDLHLKGMSSSIRSIVCILNACLFVYLCAYGMDSSVNLSPKLLYILFNFHDCFN